MVETALPDTRARIEQFAATVTGRDRVITLILEEEVGEQPYFKGLQDFMHLQSILIESNITCPALPIADVSSLLTTLNAYLTRLQPASRRDPTPCMLNSLIAHATASAPAKPLSEHHANFVSDTFCSLQDYEKATRTQEGRATLYRLLDRTTAEDVIDFWADEWVA